MDLPKIKMLTDEEFENLKVVLTIMMMMERLLYFFFLLNNNYTLDKQNMDTIIKNLKHKERK